MRSLLSLWSDPRLALPRRPRVALSSPSRIPPTVVAPSTVGRRLPAVDDLVDASAVQAHGVGDLCHREASARRSLEALSAGLGRILKLPLHPLELRLRASGLVPGL